jgi:hypothetical protein
MPNDISIPASFGKASTAFSGEQFVNNELSAGISTGYGIISYRGKVWRTKYRGEEINIMRPDGDGPEASLRVVVVKAAGNKSKIWYENGYVEGSSAAPDCWSSNGMTPDLSATKKQSSACASCKQNAVGSKINASGKPGRACADSKRLAIVPFDDIENETYGGPMLLRVPGGSLTDLATFSTKMHKNGYPYQSYGLKISFDVNEAYPKFVYSAIRPLTNEEAQKIIALQDDPRINSILAESADLAPTKAAAPAEQLFEEKAAPKIEAPKAAAKPPAPKAEPAADSSSFDDALDKLL